MKTLLIIFAVLFGLILILVLVLLIYSPGKSEPFLDKNGKTLAVSLSEKTYLTIGGVSQGMFLKSKDTTHPVLLFLHGGIPEYFLTRKYPTGLEEYFTVVWWERRGSGISYSTDIPTETMNTEQMINDAVDVTNYLRQRFGQEKIYLMAHSGGTFIGIQTAARHPELFHAYIGVAQISDQLKSEKLAYEYMMKQYKAANNMKMVRKLGSAPVTDGTPLDYLKLRDKCMHELGIGTTRDMKSIVTGVFLRSLTFTEYTLTEKVTMWRSKSRSGVAPLWDVMLATDLKQEIPKLDVPVYFLSGVYDYTVSYALTKEYYKHLQAPIKGFYTFENSAHTPIFEEPQRVKEIIEKDILKGKTDLADKL